DRERLQPLNETTGGQLNAPLLHLALEEGVGEQGDPIEKEQGRDAIALGAPPGPASWPRAR
ncbi:MAG: hypothetical protein KGS73_18950, partial [Chloroflexi bacterium]|nr:hypothetical protein [Chloroflexota bacterium]